MKFEKSIVEYIYIGLPKQTVNHYIDELGDPSFLSVMGEKVSVLVLLVMRSLGIFIWCILKKA